MKFQNVSALENHLKGGKQHFSPGYWIAVPNEFERKTILQKTISLLQGELQGSMVFSFEHPSLAELLAELHTANLFGSAKIIVCNDGDKYKKDEMLQLADYLSKPSSFAYLVLGAANFKGQEEFYQKVKKELVVLDLSEEKPWDKQKRILEQLQEIAQNAGKRLSSDAINLLLQYHGVDGAILIQELEKLITFIGDKADIDKQDVQKIGSVSITSTNWQIAEQLVWWGNAAALPKNIDTSYFLALTGQVRHHLQMGLQIASMLEENVPPGEIARLFPNVKEATMQKFISKAHFLKSLYFRSGLSLLFSMEQKIKGSFTDGSLLWDIFTAKLLTCQEIDDKEKTYFMAASQSS